MIIIRYQAAGWESWDVNSKPLITESMPVLIDDDLLFEDDGVDRPTVPVNRWLRELPVSGAPSPNSWSTYARVMQCWLELLTSLSIGIFESADRLRGALSLHAECHLSGTLEDRWSPATWNLHVSVLSRFYRWAIDSGYSVDEPFTYSWRHRYTDRAESIRRNNARRRTPQAHSTIKYLDRDYVDLFLRTMGGMNADGSVDETYRGREIGRNTAMARAVIASGLRRQEFTYLLSYEVPPLPPRRSDVPIPFPVGRGVAKGGKPRTSWIDFDSLSAVHRYIDLERSAYCARTQWQPPEKLGPPMYVKEPDAYGGEIDGTRRPWGSLLPSERLRLVAPGGGSCILALQSSGRPFTDWPTIFRRTSERIRAVSEPRFPTVTPHRLRHTFAMRTLEWLIDGHYQRAAALESQTGSEAGLALYLQRADPLCVLRDLLGHSSVTTTEIYLRRLDVMRIFQNASTKAGQGFTDREDISFPASDSVGPVNHAR